jgi:hypothetical protein
MRDTGICDMELLAQDLKLYGDESKKLGLFGD